MSAHSDSVTLTIPPLAVYRPGPTSSTPSTDAFARNPGLLSLEPPNSEDTNPTYKTILYILWHYSDDPTGATQRVREEG
jgi:hypothetical protein